MVRGIAASKRCLLLASYANNDINNNSNVTSRLVVCRNGHGETAPTEEPVEKSAERVKRLKILVQLRKLYRNLLRAERLLATTSPVHQKPAEVKTVKGMQPL